MTGKGNGEQGREYKELSSPFIPNKLVQINELFPYLAMVITFVFLGNMSLSHHAGVRLVQTIVNVLCLTLHQVDE